MKRETLACKTQNRTSGFPYTPKSLPAGQIVVNLVLSGRRLELVGKVWHWEMGRLRPLATSYVEQGAEAAWLKAMP
jgi:hypothetical protein